MLIMYRRLSAAFLLFSFISISIAHSGDNKASHENIGETVALNLALINLQQGKLDEALVNIEKVLIADPRNLDARYVRGQILYLLGRGDEVLEEIKLLSTLPLPADKKIRAKKLAQNIEGADGWQFKARIGFNVTGNDNANSFPESGIFEYFDGTSTTLVNRVDNVNDDAVAKIDDTSFGVSGSFEGKYQFDRDTLNFSISAQENDGDKTENTSSSTTAGSLGYKMVRGANNLNFGLNYTTIDRTNTVYSDTRDGQVQLNNDIDVVQTRFGYSYKFQNGWRLFYNFKYTEQDHSNTPTADDSDSEEQSHSIGALGKITGSLYARAHLTYSDREASESYADAIAKTDREQDGYGLGLFWLPNANHRVNFFYEYAKSDYATRLSTAPRIREDKRTIYGVNYKLNAEALSPKLEGWQINAGYTINENDSNLSIYEIETNLWKLTVSREFTL
jgi:tetratricopeptide (TPR) repeat protein